MYLADYHVHSRISPDASASMQEMAEAAIRLGFQEICFTDHVEPIRFGTTEPRGAYDWDPMIEEFRAARTAVGWLANGKVVLWCDKASLTREQLQNKLLGLGVVDALMLDGGGSTQGIFPGGKVISSRKVPTLLLFWERSAIKNEDQALVWGKAHGLLTDANAGETVTRADMVRALYQIWGDNHG